MQCSVASCESPASARGWCHPHYARWYRTGDPVSPRLRPWGRTPTADKRANRFWAKVDKSGGPDACWLWTAHVHHTGYGYFGWQSYKTMGAHRAAWMLTNGEIPEGLKVCHHCDNPICVNPSHLFLGSDADNAHDRDRKGRNINYRGEKNGSAKLSLAIAADIRAAFAAGESRNAISRRMGLSRTAISDVLKGRRWV